ncbi:hypothetical protein FQR65_LT09393 [Abscondita terminalis]|nr:hypothetical protein FQR65_LT09393 [Abscondita terminalis]
MSVYHGFNYLFTELADPRVYDWPLMSNPLQISTIIGVYLYAIYVFLPSYMADKKPHSLRIVIACYNIFQVCACVALIYGVATSGWTTHYNLIGCQPPDFSNDHLAVRMAACMWWTVMLKMVELLETVFFILRKKYNQVSFLHVYHHVSTLIMAWLVCKYFAGKIMRRLFVIKIFNLIVSGGMLSFTVICNSFVHVLMYTYYLLSSFGPKMQKKLEYVKPKLTIVQLVQLVILFIQNMQLLSPSCSINNIVAYIFLPNVVINIIFFIKFYIKSYKKSEKNN